MVWKYNFYLLQKSNSHKSKLFYIQFFIPILCYLKVCRIVLWILLGQAHLT